MQNGTPFLPRSSFCQVNEIIATSIKPNAAGPKVAGSLQPYMHIPCVDVW